MAAVATIAILVVATGLLILCATAFGGPRRPAPLASLNRPFAHADYSALSELLCYTARDGATLGWRHYMVSAMQPLGRRIVLVHGSAGHSASMHTLAQALAQAGFCVAALDLRGHGASGPHGQISYIGQLEHDVEDFLRAAPHAGPQTLMGFSSGGGFALRFAASAHGALFERYVLLAPFLHHNAPTALPASRAWVNVGLARLLALDALNRLGIARWNHLPVLAFALDEQRQTQLTPQYAYALAVNFRPHANYRDDIRRTVDRVRVLVGQNDELFNAQAYCALFAQPVITVPGAGHTDLVLGSRGVHAAVQACLE